MSWEKVVAAGTVKSAILQIRTKNRMMIVSLIVSFKHPCYAYPTE